MMTAPTEKWLKPTVSDGGFRDLTQFEDELFLDLSDGQGTQFLASTCYGIAVAESLSVSNNCYILKVRSDMRGLLLAQLRKNYQVARVYAMRNEPSRRYLLTSMVHIRFAPDVVKEDKLACARKYFKDLLEEEELVDGIYQLAENFSLDPTSAGGALDLDSTVLRAAPVLAAITTPTDQWAYVDLTILK
ncbi:MAG: hypothetical protein O7H41_12710 [Planctomycetota bacterium]|nr:hypothetical protein [Planctomycetota bacterium]